MNFEKKFDTYNENAHIQKSVADTLVEFLDEMGVSKEREVFEIGCGTGLFSKRFIKKFSPKKIILNDIYDVEKYLKNVRYDEFILGDIEEIDIPKIDTTVSSSVFQWLKNFSKSIEKIAHSTNELGFSMYIDGNLEEIKEHFGISLKYLTLDNVIEILTSLFSKVKWKEETIELEFSSSIEALRHLKNTGVTGFEKSSISKVRNYESKSLTYRVGYFYCKK